MEAALSAYEMIRRFKLPLTEETAIALIQGVVSHLRKREKWEVIDSILSELAIVTNEVQSVIPSAED